LLLVCAVVACRVHAATTSKTVTASGTTAFIFDGGANNPALTFATGDTITFVMNQGTSHPFSIKTAPVTGSGSRYDTGVTGTGGCTGNGCTTGSLVFTIPFNAPATLYYQCEVHTPMTGVITITGGIAPGVTAYVMTQALSQTWFMNGVTGSPNPTITVHKGDTLNFVMQQGGAHPFSIKTVGGAGSTNRYDTGVSGTGGCTGNGCTSGALVWTVPTSAPALLHYSCEVHDPMTGNINVVGGAGTLLPNVWLLFALFIAMCTYGSA